MTVSPTGYVHIYTGNGKGKTTAALGLALRARAVGKRVAIVFFDKGGEHYSERKLLPRLGIEWFACGLDRIDPTTGRFRFGVTPEDIAEAERGMAKAKELFLPRRLEPFAPAQDRIREAESRDLRSAGPMAIGPLRSSSDRSGRNDAEGVYDLVVLDEVNTTVALGMLTEQTVEGLITAKPPATELVLTGRIEVSRATRALHCDGSCLAAGGKVHEHRPSYFDHADLITEMHLVKHYFYLGAPARAGIDF